MKWFVVISGVSVLVLGGYCSLLVHKDRELRNWPFYEVMIANQKILELRRKYPFKPVDGARVSPEQFEKWITIHHSMITARGQQEHMLWPIFHQRFPSPLTILAASEKKLVQPTLNVFVGMDHEKISMDEMTWIDQQVINVISSSEFMNQPGMSEFKKYSHIEVAFETDTPNLTSDQKSRLIELISKDKKRVLLALMDVGYKGELDLPRVFEGKIAK